VTFYDWSVLASCVMAFFFIMLAHELRAMRREDRAIERHEREVKLINDARSVFLGARLETGDLSRRVTEVEHRVALLEGKGVD
jgi:hypothetical protein